MNTKEVILNSIRAAISQGIQIQRRSLFDYRGESLPFGCNAIGAVCLAHEIQVFSWDTSEFVPGWQSKVLSVLDTNASWLWRFNVGFCYGNRITFIVSKKESPDQIQHDEVSRWGDTLAKQWAK